MGERTDIPLHFLVGPDEARFVENHTTADVDRFWHEFTNSTWAWIVQTALFLRDAGLPVTVGPEFDRQRINIGLASRLRAMPRRRDIFAVSVDADQLRARWANLGIVQNADQTGPWAFWMPHWPQPGLIPRNESRKDFVNAGFFGVARNLHGDEGWWKDFCAQHGMTFSLRTPANWNDYSDIDVVLGIRTVGTKRYRNKPPTKLFNAWLAGCAFVGGMDSAYSQVGESGKNFLATRDVESLKKNLRLLRDRPEIGRALVQEGKRSVTQVGSRESTREAWIGLLRNEVLPRYQSWRVKGEIGRSIPFQYGLINDAIIRGRNAAWKRIRNLRS